MPGGDGTGPHGNGPKTGRGLGFCSGNEMGGFHLSSTGFGRGRGWGRGRRFGLGRFFGDLYPAISRENLLENEAKILKDQLASIEKQLSELKRKAD